MSSSSAPYSSQDGSYSASQQESKSENESYSSEASSEPYVKTSYYFQEDDASYNFADSSFSPDNHKYLFFKHGEPFPPSDWNNTSISYSRFDPPPNDMFGYSSNPPNFPSRSLARSSDTYPVNHLSYARSSEDYAPPWGPISAEAAQNFSIPMTPISPAAPGFLLQDSTSFFPRPVGDFRSTIFDNLPPAVSSQTSLPKPSGHYRQDDEAEYDEDPSKKRNQKTTDNSTSSMKSKSRKTPSSASSSSTKSPAATKSTRSTASNKHNQIERRYRSNLNKKIDALRESVPSLRTEIAVEEDERDGEGESDEDGEGSNRGARKAGSDQGRRRSIAKAEVLCKATEYIRDLENRVSNMERENRDLRERVAGFDMGREDLQRGNRSSV